MKIVKTDLEYCLWNLLNSWNLPMTFVKTFFLQMILIKVIKILIIIWLIIIILIIIINYHNNNNHNNFLNFNKKIW